MTLASDTSWQEHLRNALEGNRRTAIVGIGHELRADDAAGLLTVRRLRESISPPEHILLLEAGPLPESVSGTLRKFRPSLVLFVDAADMGCAPGTTDWIEPRQAMGFAGGTHAFPLRDFSAYLTQEFGCEVFFLGIQPENLEFDMPVSSVVGEAVDGLVQEIRRQISG
jgi:hydrogenase maturation protease HycI